MAEYAGPPISLSQARDCSHTSDDEDDDHSSPTGAPLLTAGTAEVSKIFGNKNGEMGLTVVVPRKPRGRPPGSKNKPKPPIVITRDSESAMRPVVLELSAGSDLIEMVTQFARRRHLCLSVISGSGTVANVTLRHPVSPASTLTLHGPFHILSLSGTFLASSKPSSSSPFAISLAGAQGQVFGGTVAGKIIAASTVVLVVATFMNPNFYRLPAGEDEEAEEEVKPGRVIAGSESTSVYSVGAPSPLNCHVPPEILPWVPASRPY
ncbi:hypothetical protein HHK36_011745 [Tetracentron sinense]|uniref:PPC domain-containing protein n=1 Tax=Tetracentron sinense TaxID=13715 RepID=A0A834ZGY9_TETSI|nr:hypothetical protein HHK36_011745 [Tetracentron sinense]